MASLLASGWPWLAVAGVGALHGLNPATGWLLAAAWGVHSRNRAQALRALLPIAVGHAASVVLVAATVAGMVELGLPSDPMLLQVLAVLLAAGVAVLHLWRRRAGRGWVPAGCAGPEGRVWQPGQVRRAGHVGLALWSFAMSTLQGAGLMLVPALVPLCTGAGAAREITASGSVLLALAAVGVHMAAMLAVTGAMAAVAGRGFDAGAAWLRRWRQQPPAARPCGRTQGIATLPQGPLDPPARGALRTSAGRRRE